MTHHRNTNRLAVLLALAILAGLALLTARLVDAAGASSPRAGSPTATVSSCHTRPCWRRVHRARARAVCVRRHGREACAYRTRYKALAAWQRGYVARLFGCEAGRFSASDPDVDGSGFIWRGEWSPGTWGRVGGDGVPSYWEEAVLVIRWLAVVGHHSTAGWPNCPR